MVLPIWYSSTIKERGLKTYVFHVETLVLQVLYLFISLVLSAKLIFGTMSLTYLMLLPRFRLTVLQVTFLKVAVQTNTSLFLFIYKCFNEQFGKIKIATIYLTHWLPMHSFSTFWKHQKTVRFSDVFNE